MVDSQASLSSLEEMISPTLNFSSNTNFSDVKNRSVMQYILEIQQENESYFRMVDDIRRKHSLRTDELVCHNKILEPSIYAIQPHYQYFENVNDPAKDSSSTGSLENNLVHDHDLNKSSPRESSNLMSRCLFDQKR